MHISLIDFTSKKDETPSEGMTDFFWSENMIYEFVTRFPEVIQDDSIFAGDRYNGWLIGKWIKDIIEVISKWED